MLAAVPTWPFPRLRPPVRMVRGVYAAFVAGLLLCLLMPAQAQNGNGNSGGGWVAQVQTHSDPWSSGLFADLTGLTYTRTYTGGLPPLNNPQQWYNGYPNGFHPLVGGTGQPTKVTLAITGTSTY